MFTSANQCLEVARICRAKAKDGFKNILDLTDPTLSKSVDNIIDGIIQAAIMEFSAKVIRAEGVQEFVPLSDEDKKPESSGV